MTTLNNGRAQRKSLATEIDRLDGILDGLDEALAGAVEMAVRDVTARVVREAVEATLREVLSNPELARARHAPVATAAPEPRRTLKEWFASKLAALSEKAAQTKRGLGSAWAWCVERARKSCLSLWSLAKGGGALALSALRLAWKFRKATAIAVGAGLAAGVAAHLAGPLPASLLCGLGGSALTLAGMVLLPLWRLMGGNA